MQIKTFAAAAAIALAAGSGSLSATEQEEVGVAFLATADFETLQGTTARKLDERELRTIRGAYWLIFRGGTYVTQVTGNLFGAPQGTINVCPGGRPKVNATHIHTAC